MESAAVAATATTTVRPAAVSVALQAVLAAAARLTAQQAILAQAAQAPQAAQEQQRRLAALTLRLQALTQLTMAQQQQLVPQHLADLEALVVTDPLPATRVLAVTQLAAQVGLESVV
jgi:hypothetical protein